MCSAQFRMQASQPLDGAAIAVPELLSQSVWVISAIKAAVLRISTMVMIIAVQQQNSDLQGWTIGVNDRVMRQLTNEGENEDPSYAPDGRHLSITRRLGAIGDQRSIWILDERTGRLRQLTSSGDARLSDWSPPLKAAF